MIPYGRQNITQADIDEVVAVLRSDFLTQGPKVPEFEAALCAYTGANYALAVNSATSALHIACLALGLQEGDYLWTTPVTFVASANCGLYCDAKVDFVDIDPKTYNLCPKALEKKLIDAKQSNRLPKIIVAVHLSGQSCDMEAIQALAKQYGVKVIEDASHAIGGRYHDKVIGSCAFSDISIFSFHPVKIITTAEGGVAMTNNAELAEKMLLLRSHGITRDAQKMQNQSQGPWYYEQIALGFNYRMTELQAALGISQLGKLNENVAARHRIAARYNRLLEDVPVTLPWQQQGAYSGFHLYIIRLRLEKIALTHRQVFESLREKGVGVNLHYIPIYRQPYYQVLGFEYSDFPQAEQYYAEAISLPLFPELTESEQDYIVTSIKTILTRAE